jgi:hypothetical protein
MKKALHQEKDGGPFFFNSHNPNRPDGSYRGLIGILSRARPALIFAWTWASLRQVSLEILRQAQHIACQVLFDSV